MDRIDGQTDRWIDRWKDRGINRWRDRGIEVRGVGCIHKGIDEGREGYNGDINMTRVAQMEGCIGRGLDIWRNGEMID